MVGFEERMWKPSRKMCQILGIKGLEMGFMGGLTEPDGIRKKGTEDILGNDGKPLMAKDCVRLVV